jgi:anti-anti-sigma regulatory factor
VDCDVSHVRRADLATVGALARAQLNARRVGTQLRVVDPSPELRELIAFAGLADALLGRSRRQAEEREQPLGVEKRSESDDPAL